MELVLDRQISQQYIYPAVNIFRSGTRREGLLMKEDEMQRVWFLRILLHDMEDLSATEFLTDKLKDFKSNNEYFMPMKRK